MGLFTRTTYRIDCTEADGIELPAIQTAPELINFCIGLNEDLLDKEEKASFLATRVKETKKGQEILYEERLCFPIDDLSVDFDEWLSPFYTKKALPYKPASSDLVQAENKQTEAVAQDQEEMSKSSVPDLPPELAALAAKGQALLQEQEETDQEEELESSEPLSESPSITIETKEVVDVEKLRLQQQVKEQEEQLRVLREEKKELEEQRSPEGTEKAPSMTLVDKPTIVEDLKEKGYNVSSVDFTESVASVWTPPISLEEPSALKEPLLKQIKQLVDTTVSDFREKELKMMQNALAQLPTIQQIQTMVTEQVKNQETTELRVIEEKNSQEKETALAIEKARYEQAVKQVEQTYTDELVKKQTEVVARYQEVLRDRLTSETQAANQRYQTRKQEVEAGYEQRCSALENELNHLFAESVQFLKGSHSFQNAQTGEQTGTFSEERPVGEQEKKPLMLSEVS
jgi:hypothetical protein